MKVMSKEVKSVIRATDERRHEMSMMKVKIIQVVRKKPSAD